MQGPKRTLGVGQMVMVALAIVPMVLVGAGTPFGAPSERVHERMTARQDAVLVWLGLRTPKAKAKYDKPASRYDCVF